MRRKGIAAHIGKPAASAPSLPRVERLPGLLLRLARRPDPVDAVPRRAVRAHRPHVLDPRGRGHPERKLIGVLQVVELHRRAVEEPVLEVHAQAALLLECAEKLERVLHYLLAGTSELVAVVYSGGLTKPSINSKM